MDSSSNNMDAERPTFHIYITDNRWRLGQTNILHLHVLCVCADLFMDLKEDAAGDTADIVWNFK